MSQSGYDKHYPTLRQDGVLLIDQDLVKTVHPVDCFAIPSTRFAEELGNAMMANIVMVGFFTGITEAVSLEAARQTVAQSVPRGTVEKNIKAFEKGWDFARATLKGRRQKAAGRAGVAA
jgi:2-oxoglutarate ferredoxin oxidoreductase subunit gamma